MESTLGNGRLFDDDMMLDLLEQRPVNLIDGVVVRNFGPLDNPYNERMAQHQDVLADKDSTPELRFASTSALLFHFRDEGTVDIAQTLLGNRAAELHREPSRRLDVSPLEASSWNTVLVGLSYFDKLTPEVMSDYVDIMLLQGDASSVGHARRTLLQSYLEIATIHKKQRWHHGDIVKRRMNHSVDNALEMLETTFYAMYRETLGGSEAVQQATGRKRSKHAQKVGQFALVF